MKRTTLAKWSGAAAAVVALAALASPAWSADFYKGKTLNVIINYGAGGNTDITARTLMQHMQKHIPGSPRIVVKNRPGAGGIVGTNFFGTAVRNDGNTIGVFSVALMPEIMKDPALTVSHRDFIFVGGIPEDTIFHARKGVGLEKATDLFNLKDPIKTAGHGPANMKDLMLRAAMDLLGVPYQHVAGFKSSGKVRGAILKNDVDMTADSMTGYASRVKPNLVDKGHSIPLFSLGIPTDDGGLGPAPGTIDGVPTFDQFYEAKFGKKPSGPKYDVLRTIARIRSTSLRAIFLPKGSPDEAVTALRTAFAASDLYVVTSDCGTSISAIKADRPRPRPRPRVGFSDMGT
ncbi:MAG: hypothetical protein AAGC70_21345, partial [Pseudomonadota bacterium]